MDFKIRRKTEKQVAQKGDPVVEKFDPPSFSDNMAPSEPNEAEKQTNPT